MLEVGNQRSAPVKLSSLGQNGLVGGKALAKIDLGRLPAAPTVQLLPRDAFVAEVSIKLDRLATECKSLAREMELLRGDIAELRDETDRNQRHQTFQEKEQRLKGVRLDEVQCRVADLKSRLDMIDVRPNGNYSAFNSLEAVSRKLTELCSLERSFRDVERKLELATWLFCGSVLAWLLIVLAF